MSNQSAATTNTRPYSATYDRARVFEQLSDLEREQAHAEQMMISAVIHERNLSVAEAALSNAMRSTGLVIPVHMNERNSCVLGAVLNLLQRGAPLTAESIADETVWDEVPFDLIARLCSIAPDTAGRTPFPYAARIDAAAKMRLELGQRVWPEALYRWFDWDGRLLYIGITRDLATRQDSHTRNSSWARFAARCTVQRYPTREYVEIMERNAIQREEPLFNHVHNDTPEARQRLVAYLVEHGHLDLLAPAVSRG